MTPENPAVRDFPACPVEMRNTRVPATNWNSFHLTSNNTGAEELISVAVLLFYMLLEPDQDKDSMS